jgi:hypothetical protein
MKNGTRVRVDNGILMTVYDDGRAKFSGKQSEIIQEIFAVVDKVSVRR